MASNINVLYIAGAGRSGSTLVGDVLGLLPGALHIGELIGVFDYTILPDENIKCSCGKHYKECKFWNSIFEVLYGSTWPERFAALRMKGKLPHSREIPFLMLRQWIHSNTALPLQVNIEEVVKVLDFIQSRFPISTIIDTSKAASFAWLLSKQPNVRLITVHLIRDPRATTFSWTQRAIPIHNAQTHLAVIRTRNQTEAASYWVKANMGAWLLKTYGIPYLPIKYESFVRNPIFCLRRIIKFAQSNGIPLAADEALLSSLAEKRVHLGQRHLLGSNPGVKSQSGQVSLKEDVAWISETTLLRKVFWTLMFLPWLIWFRYPVWAKAESSKVLSRQEDVQ